MAITITKNNLKTNDIILEEHFSNIDNNFTNVKTQVDNNTIAINDNSDKIGVLTTDLSDIVQEVYPQWNSNVKKGFNFWLADSSYTPQDEQGYIDGVVANLLECGCNSVNVVITYEIGTDGTVTRYCTDTLLTKCLNTLNANNIEIYAIKPHCFFTSDYANVITTAMTNYQTALYALETFVANASVAFVISNENIYITSDSNYTTYFNDLITYFQGKGYLVGCTFTMIEFETSTFKNNLDFIGINIYPVLTTTGLKSNVKDMSKKMIYDCNGDDYLTRFKRIREKYNKPIFISEIGCFDIEKQLLKPFAWGITGDLCGGNMQKMFYEAVLLSLCSDNIYVDGLFFWETSTSGYSPFHVNRNGKVMEVLKKYWKGIN